jgi:hypothetical protein
MPSTRSRKQGICTVAGDVQTGRGLLRPSSLPTLPDCQRRFAARHLRDVIATAGYRLKPEGPRHVGGAVGTAVHAGVAVTLKAKRATGELGNETEAEDQAEAALVEGWSLGVHVDDTSPTLATAKIQTVRMLRSYRRHLAPVVEPVLVEERLVADVGDGWQISGQADTLTGNPDERLRDLKTGTRRRANQAQYGGYVLVHEAHGFRVPQLTEDFVARVRRDAEQPPPLSIEIDRRRALLAAWEIIGAVKASVAEFDRRAADPHGLEPAGAFLANPNSSLCGQRWCPAWGTDFCRAHA